MAMGQGVALTDNGCPMSSRILVHQHPVQNVFWCSAPDKDRGSQPFLLAQLAPWVQLPASCICFGFVVFTPLGSANQAPTALKPSKDSCFVVNLALHCLSI